jgi:drug/metabolite transporter (DMT)-like permease
MIAPALLLSALGHACWDNILVWLVRNDPDASLLHMLWLRLTVVAFFLSLATRRQTLTAQHSWLWWFKFSTVGWILPNILYTVSVLWTGYRIPVSFQPFVPLIVGWRIGAPMNQTRCGALILSMLGTLVIWSAVSWKNELWMVWLAMIASILHVLCLTEWFVMLQSIRKEPLVHVSRGALLAVIVMFVVMIVWTPQHIAAAYIYKVEAWMWIVIAGGTCAACKYWVIATFSSTMSADAVAVFECVHPVATLITDIVRLHDIFEWQDVIAVTLYVCGWILYPKVNI